MSHQIKAFTAPQQLTRGAAGATASPHIVLSSVAEELPQPSRLRLNSRLIVEGERLIKRAILRRLKPWTCPSWMVTRVFDAKFVIGHSKPSVLPKSELERYCELIAALKLRTTNKQGRHLSTRCAIELLEDYGEETEQGLVKVPKGGLTRSTANEYLNRWHLGQSRLLRQPPATRFQAENSNDCWQFDLSPSDLKHIDKPDWIDPSRGMPTLMLFSVVDDRSGVAYQEYRCVYGEDAESALRFLFNAMAPKSDPGFPFQGRPKMIYLDNGPVAKRRVFQNVMQALGIEWQTHIPAGKNETRSTARFAGCQSADTYSWLPRKGYVRSWSSISEMLSIADQHFCYRSAFNLLVLPFGFNR